MGLYTIIKKIKQKEKEIHNAGKTTIVKKFFDEDINTISPTFGFNIRTLLYKEYTLNIWDVGGQKTLRAYWQNYFESTDGLIWVIDSSDIRRFNDCKSELHKLLLEERLQGASLLIFANKQDLSSSLPVEEIQQILELDKIKTHHYLILPCSSITGQNLIEGLNWLVQDVHIRIFK
ncbi:ADP-ribosylation factor-like protein 2 isoform X2 [Gordionus sp. m RMFG-2023]|uniref:ADP-ribosylation factor-like protein 2 isoform X2 n=1 Tax=Gordionus sp. m RMFG-2023 TaxID=3053472 RepID=UPI0031FBC336